jgi:hypothetical protein
MARISSSVTQVTSILATPSRGFDDSEQVLARQRFHKVPVRVPEFLRYPALPFLEGQLFHQSIPF